MTTVKLTGWKEFEEKARSLPNELFNEFDAVVEDAAGLWEERAKLDAPVDQGPLRAAISRKRNAPMDWEVVSPQEYSAFIEWGTKLKARVPAELASYAAQWKGKTSPGGAKAIYEWCRRVGIPQNAWVFVYLSIMRTGIYPHPFFFIQIPFVQKQLDTDIQQLLNTEH